MGAIHSTKISGNFGQNSMDRFGPTGKVSKKLVFFPSRNGGNFGGMDRTHRQSHVSFQAPIIYMSDIRSRVIFGQFCRQSFSRVHETCNVPDLLYDTGDTSCCSFVNENSF